MKKGVFILSVILFTLISVNFVSAALIHYWNFENNLNDSSGNASFNVVDGSIGYVEGLIGKSLELDSKDNLRALNNKIRIPNNEFSLAFFANFISIKEGELFIDKKSSDKGFALKKEGGKLKLWASGSGSGEWLKCDNISTSNIFDNNWHHIVVTARKNGNKTIYIDGKLCAQNRAGNNGLLNSENLFLGRKKINGTIDELKIWDKVLTNSEIKNDFESGFKFNITSSIATLKDNYKINEQIKLTDPPENSDNKISGKVIDETQFINENEIIKYRGEVSKDFDSRDYYSQDIIDENGNIIRREIRSDQIGEFDSRIDQIQTKLEFNGYIIEFEDAPIIVEKNRLDGEEKEIKEKNKKTDVQEDNALSTIKGFWFYLTKPVIQDKDKKVKDYSKNLKEKNKITKKKVLDKVKEKRARKKGMTIGTTGNIIKDFYNKITGKVVGSENAEEEVVVFNEFDTAYSGIALDIDDEEASEIKNIDGVKSVTPNYKVETTLMDSVPLINADDVWKLDVDGNDCLTTGKECLTGKGVTIGIIDTGVDYTHEDLGESTRPSYDFLEKVTGDHTPLYDLIQAPSSLQISNNKVFFKLEDNGEKIYYYDFNTKNISKLQLNKNYDYLTIFIANDTLVSFVVDMSKNKLPLGIVEFNLKTNKEKILVPFLNKHAQFDGLMSNNYLVFNYNDDTTRDKPLFDTYVYNFNTKELIKLIEKNFSLFSGVVNNDKVYFYYTDNINDHLIKVFDLNSKNFIKNIDIRAFPMGSFQDEILLGKFDKLVDYEIYNTITQERFEINKLITKDSFGLNLREFKTKRIIRVYFIRGDYKSVRFNDNIVVFENSFDNKFSIYDRQNEKYISFSNLIYDLIYEIELDQNKICFSIEEGGIYCFDYNSNKEYNITVPSLFNSKVIDGYDFSNNDNNPMDYDGHGTHVAATAAGNGVLRGVAPDASIYAYKVFPNSYENVIISAIERSLDPNQDQDFSDKLDVISLSLGGPGNPDDPMSTAIDNVVDAGVVAVIAAGNSGPGEGTIGSPGTSRKAITVGASDKSDIIADLSSRGPIEWTDQNGNLQVLNKPDVVAPGVNICAAQWDNVLSYKECLDDKHIDLSGTSMSTPHVSGAVALLKQKHPDWTPQEIKMALRNTAKKLIDPNNQEYDINTQGAGRINIQKAIGLTKCSDTIDNDNDGFIDYPDDQGCENSDDNDETDRKEPPSKLVNNENKNITGTLTMKLQKEQNGTWRDEKIVVSQQATIPANGLLKLDTGKDSNGKQVFAGWNNLDVKANSEGNYRVYVSFEVGIQKFESGWEFGVQ